MKYTLEFKLECVEKYKKGIRIGLPPGVKHRATFSHYLMGWAKAYEGLGVEGLMRKAGTGNGPRRRGSPSPRRSSPGAQCARSRGAATYHTGCSTNG